MTTGGKLAWGLVGIIAILHYDFWLWDSTATIFGFMPVGLAYQAGISFAAAMAWILVTKLDWPHGVEEWADGGGSKPTESEPFASEDPR